MIEVGDPHAALFASDMHLDDAAPALTSAFLDALATRVDDAWNRRTGVPADEPPAVFLLGDLFEFWIGDDGAGDAGNRFADALAAHARRGVRIYLMHGNRDFLIDVPLPAAPAAALPFSARCGATLLPDPTVVRIGGRPVLLAHGDALCTGDTRYQQWRALCRSGAWQQATLARPLAQRRALALSIRQQSRESRGDQTALDSIGDADQQAIDALMSECRVDCLVHGHTHRPALHRWQHPTGPRLRWVLSDWSTEPGAGRGAVLSFAEGLALPGVTGGNTADPHEPDAQGSGT